MHCSPVFKYHLNTQVPVVVFKYRQGVFKYCQYTAPWGKKQLEIY